MPFVLFNQRYIDNIDINDIPEEFINYFEGIEYDAQKRIIESRPDLAESLSFRDVDIEEANQDIEPSIDNTDDELDDMEDDDYDSDFIDGDDQELTESTKDVPQELFENIYDSYDMNSIKGTALLPIHLLTIPDGQEKCLAHRCTLEKLSLSYKVKGTYGMASFGFAPLCCEKCKRLFIYESEIDGWVNRFNEYNLEYKIINREDSHKILLSQMEAIEVNSSSTLYVPDAWAEDNPTCPIHGTKLNVYPHYIGSEDNKISFHGYICEECNKTLVRRTVALDIEDECEKRGISCPELKPIREEVKAPKAVVRKIVPKYMIEDGKRSDFPYKITNDDVYYLNEDNTVVVSDSNYCRLEGHNTREVDAAYIIYDKKNHKQGYISSVGYCTQCQKFYMDEDDYKVIYAYGRPEFSIIRDLVDDEYLITSGEVYNLENEHLDNLEKDIRADIKTIEGYEDYCNEFETVHGGDYDAITALQVKKAWSKEKYGPRLNELYSYKASPYRYRVDIVFANKTETYYIGAKDISLNGGKKVISMASDMGRALVNTRTIHYIKDGKQYDVKLSREFEIRDEYLFGYKNIKTDEDAVFRAGITDPFLVRVLNQRKRQHELVDIFVTIQENQNSIVDESINSNIIVQGCAGSGKTMVLLHRLYTLKYNHPEFNFDNALILTPNDRFSLHIKGLAESLQIGNIDRISIENYYLLMTRRYAFTIPNSNKISSEISVNKKFVDYIYSDEFLDSFNASYKEVLDSKKKIVSVLEGLYAGLYEIYEPINITKNSDLLLEINRRYTHISSIVQKNDKRISDAEKKLSDLLNEKQRITDRIPEAEQRAAGIINEILVSVSGKLKTLYDNAKYNVSHYEDEIQTIKTEEQELQSQVFVFGKRSKLEELSKRINIAERHRKDEKDKLDLIEQALQYDSKDKSEEEIISWIKSLKVIDMNFQEDISLFDRSKNQYSNLLADSVDVGEKIKVATEETERVRKEKYPDDVYKAMKYIESFLEDNNAYNFFREVFAGATREFKEKNKIRTTGGLHRYDLYAALWFCMKYYGENIGKSKFICFDEGQDVAFNEYKLIRELNGPETIFNIYGDTNQLLKIGRGISSWDELENKYSMKMFYLNENYRNTNQITRYCNENFDMKVKTTGVDGCAVREIPRRGLEKELSGLSLNNDKVAILLPRKVKNKNNYVEKDILPDEIKKAMGDQIDNGRIAVMYVDEVKGIEFDKVFVVSYRMLPNEKYIAYTRALSELVIVVDENIPDISDTESEKSLVGEIVDSLRKDNIEEAKTLYDDISFDWSGKNRVGFFIHLFTRVNQYEYIYKLMGNVLSAEEIKRVYRGLEEDIRVLVKQRFNPEITAKLVSYLHEKEKEESIIAILDSVKVWNYITDIPGIDRREFLLKSTSKSAGEEWLRGFSNEDLKHFDTLMESRLDSLKPTVAFNICVIAWQNGDVDKLQISKVIEMYSKKNAKGTMLYSCPRETLMQFAISSKPDEWDLVEYIVRRCSSRFFSDERIKSYPQKELSPKVTKALEQLVDSQLTLSQKIFMYMNTSLREEAQMDKFLIMLKDRKGITIDQALSELRSYWMVGIIKYVTEDGFVRVAPQNITSSRLICFWSSDIHITGEDGTWVEPKEGEKIYFLLRRFDDEKNFFTLHYPCIKPIEIKE